MGHVQNSYLIPASTRDVFAYISDPHTLAQQLSGKIEVELASDPDVLRVNEPLALMMTRYNVSVRVVVRIEQIEAPTRLVYRQTKGVFKKWAHTIVLEPHTETQTRMTDIVDFVLPFGILGFVFDDLFFHNEISRVLKYRATRITEHFQKHPRSAHEVET